MRFTRYVRAGQWPTVLGYLLFVALMVAGYYYNITFVQLGLVDLGTRLVGLSHAAVSAWMAALAALTLVVAVAAGVAMDRRGTSTDIRAKFRLLFAVVAVQFVLTAVAPRVRSPTVFGAWIVVASLALGVGFPVSFSLAIDLIPVPDRGHVAAAITAITYFAANAYPLAWSVDVFSDLLVPAMVPGLLALGVLASGRVAALERVVGTLADQHREFGTGRFCRPSSGDTLGARFLVPVVLMFGVFFVDSLGFLRIVETPALLLSSWQSPELSTRLFIAVAHVVGALMAGVLYVNFELKWLFLWTFALFALTHGLYTMDIRMEQWFPALASGTDSPLNPGIYAVAVSFYTTLNFALWPDLSTAETVGTRTAIGVGVAGWLATFLSTAVALYLRGEAVGLLTHLNLVNALALLLFFGLVVGLYARRMATYAREVDAR
jgi:MFS family permease